MIQSRQYNELVNKVVVDEIYPWVFFTDVVALFGASLGENGLIIETKVSDGVCNVIITGPKPKRFDEVCMAEWKEIGEVGWSRIMRSNLVFKWIENSGTGTALIIPGLAVAIELVAFECQPVKAKILALHSRRTIETVLRVDPKAPYRTACQLVERE